MPDTTPDTLPEGARGAKPWRPSPDDVQDEQGHVWFDFDGLPCCKRCAVVQRRDGKNKPCKGTTGGIGLRARSGAKG